MSIATSTKVDGVIYFLYLAQGNRRVEMGHYAAVVHLFEHEYDSRIFFWYGVAEVACTFLDIDRDARKAGVPDPPFGALHNPQCFELRVELQDGRWGIARHMSSTYESSPSDQHTRIAFVCDSRLTQNPNRKGE